MFPLLLERKGEDGYQKTLDLIESHLGELYIIIENYLPSHYAQVYDWVHNPYSDYASHADNLTLKEEEEVC